MTRMRRYGFTSAQRAELWDRFRRGQSFHEIARALSKQAGSIRAVVRATGGFPPPERKRSDRCLSSTEREEISLGLVQGLSLRVISRKLGRPASTVSREVARNGGRERYRATEADKRAWKNAERPKSCLLAKHDRLRQVVAEKLSADWSPQQISGWLRAEFADDKDMRISHETVYRTLFIQTRGALKKELLQHLRTQRSLRRARSSSKKGHGKGQIVGAISIRERPAEAEDRAVPGHWEGDLLSGSANSHIATLVERRSRYAILIKVRSKQTDDVVQALAQKIKKLPTELRRTLTWDRGHEMAAHQAFTVASNVQVYFCDPKSPWQRGSNENTNGLLRQYFPKGTDLSIHTQAELDRIAVKLNTRPRQTLGFKTPAAILEQTVATTG